MNSCWEITLRLQNFVLVDRDYFLFFLIGHLECDKTFLALGYQQSIKGFKAEWG